MVGPEAILPRDILVDGERITALVEPGAAAADAEIDARGLFAMPGVVDAHVHFNEPGRAEWEGWEHGSRAAACGGTTTVADMPLNSLPPTLDGAAFDAKRGAAERGSVVDFALWGGLVRADARALRELADRGAVGVKAFMCDSGVPEFPPLDDGTLEDAMRSAAAAGLLVAVHAEDPDVVREATDAVLASGRRDAEAWARSRPVRAEARAIARACEAAERSGARLHVVHVSSAEALGAIGLARERVDVTVETCPHYLTFDGGDVARTGPALKCAPPIRDAATREGLWDALLAGRVDLVASDHSPSTRALKGGGDMFAVWGGVNGVQSLLPAVMSGGLRRAQGTLDAGAVAGFVAWRLAARPAQRLGLWPRKGRLAPGADADIALVEVGGPWTLAPDAVRTRSGVTPYAGREFDVRVRRTLVRGRTVQVDGEIVAVAGSGRHVGAA